MEKQTVRQQLRTAIDKANNSSPNFCPPDPSVDLTSKKYSKQYDRYAEKLIDDIIQITG